MISIKLEVEINGGEVTSKLETFGQALTDSDGRLLLKMLGLFQMVLRNQFTELEPGGNGTIEGLRNKYFMAHFEAFMLVYKSQNKELYKLFGLEGGRDDSASESNHRGKQS